jgi:hypothetical protein
VSDTSQGYSYGLVFKNIDTKSNTLTVNYSFDSSVCASATGLYAGAEARSSLSLVEFDPGTGNTLQQISLVSDGMFVRGVSPISAISFTKESNSSASVDFTIIPSQEVGFRLVGRVTGFATVPEPSPLILACVGSLALVCFTCRNRAAGAAFSSSPRTRA